MDIQDQDIDAVAPPTQIADTGNDTLPNYLIPEPVTVNPPEPATESCPEAKKIEQRHELEPSPEIGKNAGVDWGWGHSGDTCFDYKLSAPKRGSHCYNLINRYRQAIDDDQDYCDLNLDAAKDEPSVPKVPTSQPAPASRTLTSHESPISTNSRPLYGSYKPQDRWQ